MAAHDHRVVLAEAVHDKIDPAGRLWIGTVDLTTFRPCGSLYVVELDGIYQTRLSGIRCSNGLGWTADGRTMFYTDSREMLIWAFDFDAETSSLARQRVHARIEDRNASPDGLSVDMDGCVWSALFGGSAVIQFDPAGQEVRRVQVPALRPTSCAFGGEDMRTLFITTESFQLDPAALRGGLCREGCSPGTRRARACRSISSPGFRTRRAGRNTGAPARSAAAGGSASG